MTVHKLKIQTNYLDDLLWKGKSFEVRKNDRGYRVGDALCFEDKRTNTFHYFDVLYIHEGLGLEPGYVCMSVKHKVSIPEQLTTK